MGKCKVLSPYLHNWQQFTSEFCKKFADPCLSSTADQKLEKLKQTRSAHVYFTHFVKLPSHLEITKQTKINCFMKELKPAIKDNLVSIIKYPLTLMGWKNIIIQVDANLHQQNLKQKDESKGKSTKPKPLLFQLLLFLLYLLISTLFPWMWMQLELEEENLCKKSTIIDSRIIFVYIAESGDT